MFEAIALKKVQMNGSSGYLISDGITELQVSNIELIAAIKNNKLNVVNLQLYDNDTKLRLCQPRQSVSDDEAFFQRLATVLASEPLNYGIFNMCLSKVSSILKRPSITIKHRELCKEILVIPKLLFNYCHDTEYSILKVVKLTRCVEYGIDINSNIEFNGIVQTIRTMGLTNGQVDMDRLIDSPLYFKVFLSDLSNILSKPGRLSDQDIDRVNTYLSILNRVIYMYMHFTLTGQILYKECMMKVSKALQNRISRGEHLNYNNLSVNDATRDTLLAGGMEFTNKQYRAKLRDIEARANNLNAAVNSCNGALMRLYLPINEAIINNQPTGNNIDLAFDKLVSDWGIKVEKTMEKVIVAFKGVKSSEVKQLDKANKLLDDMSNVTGIIGNSVVQGAYKSAKGVLALLVGKSSRNLSESAKEVFSHYCDISYGEYSLIDYYVKKIIFFETKRKGTREQLLDLYTGKDRYISEFFNKFTEIRQGVRLRTKNISILWQRDLCYEKAWLSAYAICCDNMILNSKYFEKEANKALFTVFYYCTKKLMTEVVTSDEFFAAIVEHFVYCGIVRIDQSIISYLGETKSDSIKVKGLLVYR